MDQQDVISTLSRQMQVKVLYTFSDESKTHCLARCPQPQQIRTARLGEGVEIGVIELRTCTQAIAAASPELVAKLGQDYTVYAYDYSEYETPLVGQGMLSWILASSSSTPTAPAHQSRTMVTGRVCQNVLGLFADGVRETLEVKLRLVPVPTCLQSEYLASMEKYRSATFLGEAPSQAADAADAWNFMSNAALNQESQHMSSDIPDLSIMSDCQASEQATYGAVARSENQRSFDPTYNTLISARTGAAIDHGIRSRPSTPTRAMSHSQSRKRTDPPSRPSSRNSIHGGSGGQMVQNEPADGDDGPQRKRAKVIRADWTGSSSLGQKSDSLLVTAATAASIRGHRPLPSGLLTSDIAAEVGERPPTPRPRRVPPKPLPPVPSLPRSLTSSTEELRFQHTQNQDASNMDPFGILAESSPEKAGTSSVESSPFNLPSSPPTINNDSPLGSPNLRNVSHFHDSGFASEGFDGPDRHENVTAHGEKAGLSSGFTPANVPDSRTQNRPLLPGPPPITDSAQVQENSHSHKPRSSSVSSARRASKPRAKQASKAAVSSTTCDDSSRQSGNDGSGYRARSPGSNSEALLRAESCMTDVSLSESLMADGTKPSKYVQSHDKKKMAIQDRLAKSIRAGEMPRFCRNCGEIKTPSWRRAFTKVERGKPSEDVLAEPTTGVIMWEPVEKDINGVVKAHRLFKKHLLKDDEGYEELALCNPCGIWLFKNKVMRPMEAWHKARSIANAKRQTSQTLQTAQAMENFPGAVPSIERDEEPEQRKQEPEYRPAAESKTNLPMYRQQRANSMGPVGQQHQAPMKRSSAEAALRRAIQSSPPRFPGSKQSPIPLDGEENSTKPTKRLLFPSPRKPGEIKSLDPAEDKSQTRSPLSASKKRDNAKRRAVDAECDSSDDELVDLFRDAPKRPRSVERSDLDLLKTPKSGHKASQGESSSLRRRHSNPITPGRALGSATLLSADGMTPFTVKLTRMLSEANETDLPTNTFSPFRDNHFGSHGDLDLGDFAMDDRDGFDLYGSDMPGMHSESWRDGAVFDDGMSDYFARGNDTSQDQSHGVSPHDREGISVP